MSDNKDDSIELLREIAKWVRFSGFGQVKNVLETTMSDGKKALAYNLSDGKNTSTTISKLTGINQPKITELWKEWASLGLGESVSASGGSRFKKSFDLRMFGMQVPEIKTETKQTSEQTAEEPANE